VQTKLIGFQDCLWRRKRKLSQNQKQIWKKAEFNQTKLDVFLTKPVTTYLDAKFAGKYLDLQNKVELPRLQTWLLCFPNPLLVLFCFTILFIFCSVHWLIIWKKYFQILIAKYLKYVILITLSRILLRNYFFTLSLRVQMEIFNNYKRIKLGLWCMV
jgi:hypothetical protein